MSSHEWLTVSVLGALVVLRDRISPASGALLGTIVLMLTGVLTSADALAGFSNPATLTVAVLYVLATAVHRTGVLQGIVERVLGASQSWRVKLTRLLVPSAVVSAFLNNTPIVAMLVSPVTACLDEKRESPSKYLLPMTYAVSLGGTLTLIGSSTNLVASGMAEAGGQRAFGMFELSLLGVPVAVVGVAVLILTAPWALPVRRAARELFHETGKEFLVPLTVVPSGPLDGLTVQAAGLRQLEGVFLVEVERRDRRIAPVSPSFRLAGGDQLTFVGKAEHVVDLKSIRGLASTELAHLRRFDPRSHPFFEAVIGPASPLVGRTLREASFRGRYQAAVIAIHRRGQPLRAKLGEISLRAGDTLLFIADPGFRRNDFLIVSRIGRTPPGPPRKGRWIGALLVGVVLLSAMGVLPLLHAALLATVVVVLSGVLTANEVREAIDLDVIVVVACSFALGLAVQSSGLSHRAADAVIFVSSRCGPRAALVAVAVLTVLAAQFLTCNAAAALGVPLALAAATKLGVNPRGMLIAVTIAASSSYLTPFGYQTKMMIYGPGGYCFADYARLGLPLTLSVIVTIAVAAPIVWPW